VSLRLEHISYFVAVLFRESDLDAKYGSMKAHYINGSLAEANRFHVELLGRSKAAVLQNRRGRLDLEIVNKRARRLSRADGPIT
jgi:hypothetical protein